MNKYRFIKPFVDAQIARAEARQIEIFEYVRERPGITCKEIAAHFKIDHATAVRHMRRIKDAWRKRDKQ